MINTSSSNSLFDSLLEILPLSHEKFQKPSDSSKITAGELIALCINYCEERMRFQDFFPEIPRI